MVLISYDGNTHLKKNVGHSVAQVIYAQIINGLMYLMNNTRPDIIYAVSKLFRLTQNLKKDQQTAIARLARYLRGTSDYKLKYSRFLLVLERV